MAIYRGVGGAGNSTDDSVISEVQTLASQAEASATSAATSATNASTSASAASTSATNAAASASNAATILSNASGQVGLAQGYANDAESSAEDAAAASVLASTYRSQAQNSANSASNSAATATTQADLASTYVTTVSGLVDGVEADKNSAAASASAASTSASNASTSANTATTQASNAAASALSATTQAGIATTQATNASNSATSASTSASASSTSATNAANSATAAAGSASDAADSAALAYEIAFSPEAVRHSVRPSLLLDFANTKTLDPRITFTRGSTGTFYDGKTVAKAEENLLLQSQFASGWSVNFVTTTTNSTTAPDGTTTAATLASTNSANAGTSTYRIISAPIGSTFSVYAKAGTSNFLGLTGTTSGSSWANFNLSTGAVASSGGCTASIVSAGNGWYRCTMANMTVALQYSIIAGKDADPAGNPYSNGLWTSGNTIYIWGAQLEQRSSVTAYTPTTTAPITNYIPALQTAGNNVPRFEHNPVTGESLGLEIEEQRTNLLTYSDDFSNAAWTTADATITSNAVVAPDGTLTADVLNATAGNFLNVRQGFSVVSNNTVSTVSIYLKKTTSQYVRVVGAANTTVNWRFQCTIDLDSGTITQAGAIGADGVYVASSVTSVGNGWYRVSLSGAITSQSTYRLGVGFPTTSTNTTSTTTGECLVWGAQAEIGSFATSYIPTVASQVTRSADSASMTGTNFSSWFGGAPQGTVYTETTSFGFVSDAAADRRHYFTLNNNNGTSQILVYATTSGVQTVSRNNGDTATTSTASGVTSLTNGQVVKYSTSYTASGFSRATNGVAGTDVVRTINSGVFSTLFIGVNDGDARRLNGTMRKFAFYPKALTNEELQGLTTI